MTGQAGVSIELQTSVDNGSITWDEPVDQTGTGIVSSDGAGSAGITIDLQTQVSIGEVVWTDTYTTEDALYGGIGGGSVVIGGIRVGGADTNSALDNVRVTIDSGKDLLLLDGTVTSEGKDALVIELGAQDFRTIDLGLDIDYFALGGHMNPRVSNLRIDVELGPQAIVIHEDLNGVGVINMSGFFKVTDLDVDLNALGAKVRNVAIGDIDWSNSTLSGDASSHYAWNQGALRHRLDLMALQVDEGKSATLANVGVVDKSQLEAEILVLESDPNLSAADQERLSEYRGALSQYEALENRERGVDYLFSVNSDDGINLNQTAAGMSQYSVEVSTAKLNRIDSSTGQVETYDTLWVGVDNFQADIGIGDIQMGQGSIGSLAIDNLSLSNTSLVVFGR